MPTIRLRTPIDAPTERCFDVARSIDLHVQSQIRHREEAIAGVTTGLIGMDDDVTWRARHLGVRQTMTIRITRFDRPTHFRDVMVRGAFRRFEHDHYFEPTDSRTVMTDVCAFDAPWGWLGTLVSTLVLTRYFDPAAGRASADRSPSGRI